MNRLPTLAIIVLMMAALAASPFTGVWGVVTPASAATGDLVHQVTFSVDCSTGVGIAHDGTNLWWSCAGGLQTSSGLTR